MKPLLPLKKLEHFFSSRPEIDTALLYGSFAKGRVRPSSDVDIAVLLGAKQQDDLNYLAKLSVALQEICPREVEVISLNQASPHLAFRAIQEGKIIFQRNRARWIRFVVKTISMNEDLEILYRKVGRG